MKGNGTIATNVMLGFVFLSMGVTLAISAGFVVGMSFVMTGVVFLILGLAHVGESRDADESRG